jgi:hypothetical protein
MRTPMAVAAAAFTAAMVLVPMSAEATCTQVIYAERAISTANTTQLAGRTTSTSLIIWFGSTADDTLASLIHSAVAQRNRVQITGDAAACPVAPATGNRSVGTIISLVQQP